MKMTYPSADKLPKTTSENIFFPIWILTIFRSLKKKKKKEVVKRQSEVAGNHFIFGDKSRVNSFIANLLQQYHLALFLCSSRFIHLPYDVHATSLLLLVVLFNSINFPLPSIKHFKHPLVTLLKPIVWKQFCNSIFKRFACHRAKIHSFFELFKARICPCNWQYTFTVVVFFLCPWRHELIQEGLCHALSGKTSLKC